MTVGIKQTKRADSGIIDKSGKPDLILLIVSLLLAAFGTVMVFSAGQAYAAAKYDDSLYFIKRQSVWLIIGIAVMLFASFLKIEVMKRLTPLFYIITLILLVLTLMIGFVGNGAQRWITIGPLTIQPSEIAKLTLIMMLAFYFEHNQERACQIKGGKDSFIHGTVIPIIIMIIPIILVMLQRHLSCIIILGLISLIIIVLAGVNTKYILTFTGIGAIGVACIAVLTDYTKDRITVWQNPEAYKLTGGWQTLQGLMAIGSGGLFGKGLGMGELKHCYVSEPANDMIFAILCEELGFIGGLITMIMFALLVWRGFLIGIKNEQTYERLLCLGISTKIAIQVLLNIAVVTNTIPNTGISLPFFSYGGSSLIMICFEVGLLLSLSRKTKMSK